MSIISIIIPAYNEEKNVPIITKKIIECFNNFLVDLHYEIIFINDGSHDNTQKSILEEAEKNENVYFINFSRNFGQRNAIKAALDYCHGDCAISIDCDMQHPIELIPQLVKKWQEGNHLVCSLREEDKSLPYLKRLSSKVFHRFISFLSNTQIDYGVSDFRLMDRKIINVAKNLNEKDIFWRGIVRWVGFKYDTITYTPNKRLSGETSYTMADLYRLAITGIVSFSVKPLHFGLYIGLGFTFLSLLYIPFIIYSFVNDIAVSGWSSIIMLVLFFGGIQLIVLGIIGYYLGEMFMQAKQRPNYIINDTNLK